MPRRFVCALTGHRDFLEPSCNLAGLKPSGFNCITRGPGLHEDQSPEFFLTFFVEVLVRFATRAFRLSRFAKAERLAAMIVRKSESNRGLSSRSSRLARSYK